MPAQRAVRRDDPESRPGRLGASSGLLRASGGGLGTSGGRAGDVAVAEQALTPSTAATATVSAAAALRPPWDGRPPGRDIDMPPIMPDAIRCLALMRPEPSATGSGQDAAAR